MAIHHSRHRFLRLGSHPRQYGDVSPRDYIQAESRALLS